MSEKVYIAYKKKSSYPDNPFLTPDIPEYPLKSKLLGENDAYELVREGLKGYGLDTDNFGKKEWNPFGTYIHPGDTVLIKPNLVMDHNENRKSHEHAMECLVTHTSVIKAVCDYCIIAQKGKGRLIVGDAPMQGCDFKKLIEKMEYDKLIEFYKLQGINIELKDLRQFESRFNNNRVITGRKYTDSEGVIIEVGKKSAHCMSGNQNYQVSDYEKLETQAFHKDGHHSYEVSKTMLEADVIINLPKPKTHRLAGITAGMKNMVGITYNKASLPHRVAGSTSEGGDAYNKKSILKKISDKALTAKIKAEKDGRYGLATICRYIYGGMLVAGRTITRDPSYIGSWYGNDTIWRTVVDLNYITQYADKSGNIKDIPQRKMLNIGDMIIAGQGNGPVSPEPKRVGAIVISDDVYAFDRTVCRMMGFDEEKIPMFRGINHNIGWIEDKFVNVMSSIRSLNGDLQDIQFPEQWKFKPYTTWIGHIEK